MTPCQPSDRGSGTVLVVGGLGLLVTAVVLLAWVAYRVLYRNWKAGHRPSPTFLIPYLAMLLWFAPCFRQPDFFFYVVPFFHSLQYLTFVYRVERSRPSIRPASS